MKTSRWVRYDERAYREEFARLVHFSSKVTSTNCPASGIRLDATSALSLPVVAVRTLIDVASIPLDYLRCSGPSASLVRQYYLAAAADPVAADDGLMVLRAYDETAGAYSEGLERVDARLRQILLPTEDGGYLAVSPLGCAGLSVLLADKLRGVKRKRARLMYGGGNPQNLGAHAFAMRRALFAPGPVERPQVRAAWAISHRGVDLTLPDPVLDPYRDFRSSSQPATVAARDAERALVEGIARYVLRRADRARALLADAGLSLASDDSVSLGLIDPSRRDAAWSREAGKRIARAVAAGVPDHPLTGREIVRVAQIVRGVLR